MTKNVQCRNGYVNHWEAQPPILLTINLAQLSMVNKENLPKRNLTRSGNLFWMHCKYKFKLFQNRK